MTEKGKALAKGTIEKALEINLDQTIYGTIAEIGAGQEVARNFFQAGGAAGTIAKTMSAYDMQVSDAIYGEEPDGRYVSQSRVAKMIDREYRLVVERLSNVREKNTRFFSFANTVAARSYKSKSDCHGWLGFKYQISPGAEPVEIVLHVRMLDKVNTQQQVALGRLGVNLMYGAFYLHLEPRKLIESLLDNLDTNRIEIDMIRFDGSGFSHIDNRLMALQLVRSKLTRSVFFTNKGDTIQPSDLLYKKNILLLRGSFRPITNVHVDIINSGLKEFQKDPEINKENLVLLTEISMAKLFNEGNFSDKDFLGRVDTLCKLGYNIQISNHVRYFHLKKHFDNFTIKKVVIVLGIRKIQSIFNPLEYRDLQGGILEAVGYLFSGNTRLFVYPRLGKSGQVISLNELCVNEKVKYLFKHFLHNKKIISLSQFDNDIQKLDASKIQDNIRKGTGSWEDKVPKIVSEEIIRKKLFDFGSSQ